MKLKANTALAKTLIATFCIWHMFAVGIYALPREAQDAPTQALQHIFLPVVSPYIFITSQWQQWNLFSPDPLRAVYQYRIDHMKNGNWEEVVMLTPDSHPEHRHADEVKLLGRIHEPGFDVVRYQYLKDACKKYGIPAGTTMRMYQMSYIINEKPSPGSDHFWQEGMISETTCSPS